MKIEFETADVSPDEAAGLVALLVMLCGSSALRGIEHREAVNYSGITVPPLAEVLASHAPANHDQPGAFDPNAKAADGYPAEEAEPDAATAFGASPPSAPAGDVDKAGIPWDERIHSSTKGTNKDGTWSRRRNTPDDVFDTVMAELRAPRQTPAAAAPPAPPAPPATAADGPPPPPAAAAPISFPTLLVKITKAQTAGKITKAEVDGILASFEIASMPALAQAGAEILAGINAMVDGHVGQ